MVTLEDSKLQAFSALVFSVLALSKAVFASVILVLSSSLLLSLIASYVVWAFSRSVILVASFASAVFLSALALSNSDWATVTLASAIVASLFKAASLSAFSFLALASANSLSDCSFSAFLTALSISDFCDSLVVVSLFLISVSLGLLLSDLIWIGSVTLTSTGLVISTSVGFFGSKGSLSLHEPNVSVSKDASATGRRMLFECSLNALWMLFECSLNALYNVFSHSLIRGRFVPFSGFHDVCFGWLTPQRYRNFLIGKYISKNFFQTKCLIYTFCLLKSWWNRYIVPLQSLTS